MQDDPIDDRLFTHLLTILSFSAAMVGAGLTAIGITGVFQVLKRFETICDDLMAADSFLFLATAVLCFVGLRTPCGSGVVPSCSRSMSSSASLSS